jgi:predicted PurR-regulated permease PerM
MKEKSTSRWLWILFGILVFLTLCWVFRTIIAYVIVSIVIGFMGDPVVTFLRRIKIGRFQLPTWFCALFTLALFISLFIGFFWVLAPVIASEVEVIMNMDVDSASLALDEKLDSFSSWLNNLGLEFDAVAIYETAMERAQSLLSLDTVKDTLNGVVGFLSSLSAAIFSVLFISFFFLKDGSLFHKMVFTLTPDKYMMKVKSVLIRSHKLLTRYFVGVFLQTLIMMLMLGIGLFLFGVENAFIIAVFGGLVNVIPYLGPFISIAFGLFIGLTTGLSIDPAMSLTSLGLKIIGVHMVALAIDAFLVQPLILGNSVRAHPLEIFLVILAAGTVGGILGMVLALPLYSILRIVASEFFAQFKVVESLTRRIDED